MDRGPLVILPWLLLVVRGSEEEFNWKRCVIRTTILMTAVFLAETVPRFDLVMGLIGAALTGPLMFFLPPLFYIRLNSKLREREESLGLTRNTRVTYYPSRRNEGMYPKLPMGQLSRNGRDYGRLSEFSDENDICGIAWETLLAYLVVIIGVGATITATYFGMEESIRFSRFIPSCLQNSTAASDLALFLDVDSNGNVSVTSS